MSWRLRIALTLGGGTLGVEIALLALNGLTVEGVVVLAMAAFASGFTVAACILLPLLRKRP